MNTKNLLLITSAMTLAVYMIAPQFQPEHTAPIASAKEQVAKVNDHPLTRCAQRDGSRLVVRDTARHSYGEGLCTSPF